MAGAAEMAPAHHSRSLSIGSVPVFSNAVAMDVTSSGENEPLARDA